VWSLAFPEAATAASVLGLLVQVSAPYLTTVENEIVLNLIFLLPPLDTAMWDGDRCHCLLVG
jgi:hypothetical protein